MREPEARDAIRAGARAYEEALPPEQRKQLGQYFTGLQLGKLLAHLALNLHVRTVLDPMAGHGDLLDSTWEAAGERGITLDRLDGIEIDEVTAGACRNRLAEMTAGGGPPAHQIVGADAFDPNSVEAVCLPAGYDLVITNPPYVRYQVRNANGGSAGKNRSGLVAIINSGLSGIVGKIWKELAENYSGLADLSVPAWLLAGAMVRSGGRLALVVPATWRSRDYADVIRYLLLRCFSLECVIEDEQPGWFSDALVRTHLIVAQRLPEEVIAEPLGARAKLPETPWLQIAPEAATASSLVGEAFVASHPESQFAKWVREGCKQPKIGIKTRSFSQSDEWSALETKILRRTWYHRLEGNDLPLFDSTSPYARIAVPNAMKDVLPESLFPFALVTLDDAGICVGQGLRTGCNRFFYVTARGSSGPSMMRVEASSFFEHAEFSVPACALRPVLRRQSEIASLENGRLPDGRVLDLRGWVLPGDFPIVMEVKSAYTASGGTPPQIMPDELAAYVRKAAAAAPAEGDDKRIPDLSAVCTNVRMARNGQVTPRFWYMLPEYARRHLPAVFVARINHSVPWVEANLDPPLLIDANFSTFWAPKGGWTCYGLKALLNSVWCRAFMEAVGTPLGGGALKLEATHLRQIAIPVLSDAAKAELARAGRQLTKNASNIQSRIDAIILEALLGQATSRSSTDVLAKSLAERANSMACARRSSTPASPPPPLISITVIPNATTVNTSLTNK